MRNFCCRLMVLLATGILFSCGSKSAEKKFFDIPGYFKKEIEYIKTHETTVSKTSEYNGSKEIKQFAVSEINWEKEFAIFLECNINKPAYYSSMNVQGSFPQDGDQTEANSSIAYVNNNPALTIHDVVVSYEKKMVIGVGIHLEKSNLISITFIDALYLKDSLYTISGEQRIRNLGDKNTFYVKGQFN